MKIEKRRPGRPRVEKTKSKVIRISNDLLERIEKIGNPRKIIESLIKKKLKIKE